MLIEINDAEVLSAIAAWRKGYSAKRLVNTIDDAITVAKNRPFALRAEVKDGMVNVRIHQVVEGKDVQPRGYMLGSNMLIYRLR